MTLTEIRTFVKSRYRISVTEMDTFIAQVANEAMAHYARRAQWRQLKSLDTSITTTTAQSYDLASDFSRLIQNSVRYDVTSTYAGRNLPDVGQDRFEAFKMLSTASAPSACIVGPKSASTAFQLYLAPAFTETGKVIKYDYIKKPTALSSGSDSLQVPELDYAVCYSVLTALAEHDSDEKRAAYFRSESMKHFNSAVATIVSDS